MTQLKWTPKTIGLVAVIFAAVAGLAVIGGMSETAETEVSRTEFPGDILKLDATAQNQVAQLNSALMQVRQEAYGVFMDRENGAAADLPQYRLERGGELVGHVKVTSLPDDESAFFEGFPDTLMHAHFDLHWMATDRTLMFWCNSNTNAQGKSGICS